MIGPEMVETAVRRQSGAVRCGELAAVALCALLTACGSNGIELSIDRSEISAGGIDAAKITAHVRQAGDPAKNVKISFETTAGSFSDGSTLQQSKDVGTDAEGVATIKLYSAASPGSATVTATYYDDVSGITSTASIQVKFTQAAGDKRPVDGTFRLTCDAVNIGGLREPIPDVQVACRITAQTRGGQAIPSTALVPRFLTEAGSFTRGKDAYTGKQVYYYSPKGGASSPLDVSPESSLNEPSYRDANGRQRNPRDGLVTLIAIVDGEESFTDLDGNGKHDRAEPFVDSAEPFVDADDDDKWDRGEKYLDVNGNGRWDAANGHWDAKTKIMAIYKIVWSGKLDNSSKTSRIARSTSDIAAGGKLELKAYLLDANLNPIAAFQKNTDYLEWTLTSGGDAVSNDETQVTLSNERGLSFDKSANTERKRWKILSNSFSPRVFRFTVQDGYPKDTSPATSFTVAAKAYVTPGPTSESGYATQLTETLTDKVQGTCE